MIRQFTDYSKGQNLALCDVMVNRKSDALTVGGCQAESSVLGRVVGFSPLLYCCIFKCLTQCLLSVNRCPQC